MRKIALTAVFLALTAGRALAAPSCSFSTVSSLPFGTYDPYSLTPIQIGGGSIDFSCNAKNVAVTVDLDMGSYSPAFGQRRMHLSSGSDYLAYNIYYDAAYSEVFGDGTGGTVHYSATTGSKNSTNRVSYYGQLPAGQDATVGSYADTVKVTISF